MEYWTRVFVSYYFNQTCLWLCFWTKLSSPLRQVLLTLAHPPARKKFISLTGLVPTPNCVCSVPNFCEAFCKRVRKIGIGRVRLALGKKDWHWARKIGIGRGWQSCLKVSPTKKLKFQTKIKLLLFYGGKICVKLVKEVIIDNKMVKLPKGFLL